jgi:CBS domain-containing protein
MKISHLLATKGDYVATVTPETTVRALVAALAEHKVGALVVSSDGRRIDGIVSERDVVRTLHLRGADLLASPVSAIMTAQVSCTTADAGVDNLMALMTDQRIRHVPVVDDDGLLVGIISIGDIVKSRLGELEGEREALIEYITAGR